MVDVPIVEAWLLWVLAFCLIRLLFIFVKVHFIDLFAGLLVLQNWGTSKQLGITKGHTQSRNLHRLARDEVWVARYRNPCRVIVRDVRFCGGTTLISGKLLVLVHILLLLIESHILCRSSLHRMVSCLLEEAFLLSSQFFISHAIWVSMPSYLMALSFSF